MSVFSPQIVGCVFREEWDYSYSLKPIPSFGIATGSRPKLPMIIGRHGYGLTNWLSQWERHNDNNLACFRSWTKAIARKCYDLRCNRLAPDERTGGCI